MARVEVGGDTGIAKALPLWQRKMRGNTNAEVSSMI
jgi:hypothetical protein